MGYQRKDGKYVGDDGKLYANYNDALAQANSLRGRAAVEQALAETQQQISDRQGTLAVHQFLQRNIGAPLGFGGAYDSGNQSLNKELRGLESQQRVLTNTLNDYRRRMGEGEPSPDASGRDDQGADLDMEFIRSLKDESAKSLPQEQPRSTGLSDDADVRQSALEAMRQQYAPSTGIYDTDAGKAMLASAQQAQYTGDQAGLADFYANQQKVGAGLSDEIIDAMGYTGGMAEWAKANPALAMREYNKKFANSYEGTGPDNAAIQQAMDQGKFFPSEGSPNPLGETGVAREMNTAQISAAQPTNEQFYAKEGLLGKKMLEQLLSRMESNNFRKMGGQ